MSKTKEDFLAKRIIKFPEDNVMDDESIKRNVYAAMEEYAQQQTQDLRERNMLGDIGMRSLTTERDKYKAIAGELRELLTKIVDEVEGDRIRVFIKGLDTYVKITPLLDKYQSLLKEDKP